MADKSPKDILAEWRELERLQQRAEPDGYDFGQMELDIARLRSEYHRLTARNVSATDQLEAASRETMRRVQISRYIAEQSRVTLRNIRRGSKAATTAEDVETDS